MENNTDDNSQDLLEDDSDNQELRRKFTQTY